MSNRETRRTQIDQIFQTYEDEITNLTRINERDNLKSCISYCGIIRAQFKIILPKGYSVV